MKNMRTIVEKGYDEGDYLSAYRLDKEIDSLPLAKSNIDRLMEHLSAGASILDLGCGPGIPFDEYLTENGLKLTGIDICRKHIDLARTNVPDAEFIRDDISGLKFEDQSFDAIISLYTIFHIPREEHKDLLLNIHRMLKDGGLALVTMGTEDEENVGEFIGSEMAWSSYTLDDNLRLVQDCSFQILHWDEEGPIPEHHLWILARKK